MPFTHSPTRTLHLHASPNPAFVDQPIHLRLLPGSALPKESVHFTAWLVDDVGRRWESHAEFTADAHGAVDLARHAPTTHRKNSYQGVDPMGLFWSMQLNRDDAGAHDQYLKRELTPTEITIEASVPSLREIARLRIERHHVPPGVTVRALDERSLAGLLFLPSPDAPAAGDSLELELDLLEFNAENTNAPSHVAAGSLDAPSASASHQNSANFAAPRAAPSGAPRHRKPNEKLPAVITLGGSGGGLDWETAAALAGHGYAALALPYFGFDPLPSSLNSIPLEYFERAIAWLCRQPEIDPGRLAIHGISRGGELALLLATKIPLIRAVVGVVPGNVVWQATGTPPPDSTAALISNFNSASAPLAPSSGASLPNDPPSIRVSQQNSLNFSAPRKPQNEPPSARPSPLPADTSTAMRNNSSAASSAAASQVPQPDSSNLSANFNSTEATKTSPSTSIQNKNATGIPPVAPPFALTPSEAPSPAAKKSRDPNSNDQRSSWTYRGTHIPFVPYAMGRFRILTAIGVISFRRPVRFVNLHRDSLRQRDATLAAEIPVEDANAAILLISASDDQVWPSESMSDAIIRRLESHHYAHEFTHQKNPGAGHLIRLPFTPATTYASKLANFGLRTAFGGTPAATAAARRRSWRTTLAFLSRNLT